MLKDFFSRLLRIYFPKKRELSFTVNINYNEFLRYYKGQAQTVRLKADNGQIIVFPAAKLRPFVDHAGIRGRFVIAFDKNNKFISIKRI
jgi:hypothetical protein